jgi:hypothetical protein
MIGMTTATQSVYDVMPVPESRNLIFCVQRSSDLVVYDPDKSEVVRKVPLGGIAGNPELHLHASELWAMDYDTLVVLGQSALDIRRRRRLQETGSDVSREPVGDYNFMDDGTCVVARPMSSDVLLLDPRTLKTIAEAKLSRQPLHAVALEDGRVFARDWQSGDVLSGTWKKLPFWKR